ncbi:hypothetical protein A2841_04020 [Candidatus Kaiserbacteria bacterium RIFCSPHIGHO2_01_FULL_48_10]|uniref:Uncharacterized protein n=1 Tax=Candidatus Kaiserbacteria bacterium RIFCSPHIGHO2_01_FULL_48_10 TaxID=1798476 RepID=A0A1F6C490_9BACT|nr:MAG: hypothetical protein A2841_04020 [Candidatus Kaiserbacteria bacterium RIFCSPHIGHO2_01_FULL_48_10]
MKFGGKFGGRSSGSREGDPINLEIVRRTRDEAAKAVGLVKAEPESGPVSNTKGERLKSGEIEALEILAPFLKTIQTTHEGIAIRELQEKCNVETLEELRLASLTISRNRLATHFSKKFNWRKIIDAALREALAKASE